MVWTSRWCGILNNYFEKNRHLVFMKNDIGKDSFHDNN